MATTSLNPGVGPTNADIATAVASSVPTIGAITTAITTNAASAGVTLAAIGTTVASNSSSPLNWTLISSIAGPAAGVTFSSLSGYKSYLVVISGSSIVADTGGVIFRLNGVTTALHQAFGFQGNDQNNLQVRISGSNTAAYATFNGNGGNVYGWIRIDQANTSNPKTAESAIVANAGGSNGFWNFNHVIPSTAATTSITVTSVNGVTFGSTNPFTLYGAN